MTPTTPRIAAAAAVGVLMLLAGCTTPTPGGTPTPTATPSVSTSPATPTTTPPQVLSADQQAALDALARLDGVWTAIGRDPSAYTEKQLRAEFGRVMMPPLLPKAIEGSKALKEAGYREVGESIMLWVKADKVERLTDGVLRVEVTRCVDQRTLRVVDQSGAPAPATWQYPKWRVQAVSLRRVKAAWRAAGTWTDSTKQCGGAR